MANPPLNASSSTLKWNEMEGKQDATPKSVDRDKKSSASSPNYEKHFKEVAHVSQLIGPEFPTFKLQTRASGFMLVTTVSLDNTAWTLDIESREKDTAFLLRSDGAPAHGEESLTNSSKAAKRLIDVAGWERAYAGVRQQISEALGDLCTVDSRSAGSSLAVTLRTRDARLGRAFSIEAHSTPKREIVLAFPEGRCTIRDTAQLPGCLSGIKRALLNDIECLAQVQALKEMFSDGSQALVVEPEYGENSIRYHFGGRDAGGAGGRDNVVDLHLTDLPSFLESGLGARFLGHLHPPFEAARAKVAQLREGLLEEIRRNEAASIRDAQRNGAVIVNTTYPYENERADIVDVVGENLSYMFRILKIRYSKCGRSFDKRAAVGMWRQVVVGLHSLASGFVSRHGEEILLTKEGWEACLDAFTEEARQAAELQPGLGYIEDMYAEFNRLTAKNYKFAGAFSKACAVMLATELDPRYSFDMKKFQGDEKALFPETYLIERD